MSLKWRSIIALLLYTWVSLPAQSVENLPAMQETQVWFLGQEDPLEKEMATYSSILAWESYGLYPGVTRVGHDLATKPQPPPLYSLYLGIHACVLSQVASDFSCIRLCNPMECCLPGSSVHWFSRQEHWSGLPCPPLGYLPEPRIKPVSLMSPVLGGGFFTCSTI